MSDKSREFRDSFKKADDVRDAGLTAPDEIVRYDDIVYGSNHKWQVLDVYRPVEAGNKPLPVIISVHGGGWVYGDKERYQYYCMELAKHGFAVINFTYRLAPEYKFPAPLEDTNLVVRWMLLNAEKYKLDINNVFAVGDSAGAHNLGLYTAMCTNPDYASQYEFSVPEHFCFKAIALNCGVYKITDDDSMKDLIYILKEDFLVGGLSEKERALLDVSGHITDSYPPTFFMTCTGDFLKEQAPIIAKKLAECEVPFVYRFYGDSKHQLGHVFHCNVRSREASLCNLEECEFFKKYISIF